MKRAFILIFFIPFFISAQKKPLDHSVYDIWKSINNPSISMSGEWVVYSIDPEQGDGDLFIQQPSKNSTSVFPRGKRGRISFDNNHIIFTIIPHADTVLNMKRRKVKKDEMPRDSLGIFNTKSISVTKIPGISDVKVPEKWSGIIAFRIFPAQPEGNGKPKSKKVNGEGLGLIIMDLNTGRQDTVPGVTDYVFAREAKELMMISGGKDSTMLPGVYRWNFSNNQLEPIFRSKGKYKSVTLDEKGGNGAFIADLDTTKAKVRPWNLYVWKKGVDSAKLVAKNGMATFPQGWIISDNANLDFSKSGNRLFFGTAPPPLHPDTTKLPEELAVVEVWNYKDQRLYTQQNISLNQDKLRSYTTMFNINDGKISQLEQEDMNQVRMTREKDMDFAIGLAGNEYQKFMSWQGRTYSDIYLVNMKTGSREKILTKKSGFFNLSPSAKYIYWYSEIDSAHFTYSIATKKVSQITNNNSVLFYNELNDVPDHPGSYGNGGWTKDDKEILIYDRFDIWSVDPENKRTPVNLTKTGRSNNTRYRIRDLDEELTYIDPGTPLLLESFNEVDKSEGFYSFSLKDLKAPKELIKGNFSLSVVEKSQGSDGLLFTRETFQKFPDLQFSDLSFLNPKQITETNPQQQEYLWGTVESYYWTSLDGKKLEGLLFKPENFDPSKKYPLIVNFYERSSNGLNSHRIPYAHRSTINYPYYLSNGYVIFNPDIPYRIGYPGESAFNSVIPGVSSLIDQGFVDKERIGVQGHSWGGYQIAYLVTKTDIFKCAESGAPVVNMISAYGGIRWGTGLSRMFQYEHTQSRIGGTLWETPVRYIENSPIFFIDKINTPLLIMHNDNDSAVPWYQGIEFFVALRRLGKPAWMLNYNGEPHWPLKPANRKDFVQRMSQFFDYYLKDAPMPVWMDEGIPAINKGIDYGLEPSKQ